MNRVAARVAASQEYRCTSSLRKRAEILVHGHHLSVPQAARVLHVCANTVRRHLERDDIRKTSGRSRLLTNSEELELEVMVRANAQRDAMDRHDLAYEVLPCQTAM